LYFIVWSLLLLPFISYHIVKGFKLKNYFWLPNCILLLAFYSTVTGVLLHNSYNYIAQDLYKFLFIPAMMYATFRLPARVTTSSVLTFAATTILVYYCIRIIIFLLFNSSGKIYYGTPQELFAVCVNLAILTTLHKGQPISQVIGKLGLMSILTIAGQKKTIAIGLALVFIMAAVKSLLRINVRLLILFSLLLAVTGGTLFWLTSTSKISVDRYISADIQGELGVDSSRQIEVQVALNTLSDSEFGYIFGLGGGVTLKVPRISRGQLVIGTTHSMHNTMVTQLTRYGVFGILAYGGILFYGLSWAFKNRNSGNVERAMLANVALSYKTVAFLASFVIYGIMDDVLLALLAGLILRHSRLDAEILRQNDQSVVRNTMRQR